MTAQDVRPCRFCGYEFDHEALGPVGCANCNGEGLDDAQEAAPVTSLLPGLELLVTLARARMHALRNKATVERRSPRGVHRETLIKVDRAEDVHAHALEVRDAFQELVAADLEFDLAGIAYGDAIRPPAGHARALVLPHGHPVQLRYVRARVRRAAALVRITGAS